jgi:hypothetical protein
LKSSPTWTQESKNKILDSHKLHSLALEWLNPIGNLRKYVVSKNDFRRHLKKSCLFALIMLTAALEFSLPVQAYSEASSEASSEAPQMTGRRGGRRRWYYQQMRQQQQAEKRQLQQQQRQLNQQNQSKNQSGRNTAQTPHMQIKRWGKARRNNNLSNTNNPNQPNNP